MDSFRQVSLMSYSQPIVSLELTCSFLGIGSWTHGLSITNRREPVRSEPQGATARHVQASCTKTCFQIFLPQVGARSPLVIARHFTNSVCPFRASSQGRQVGEQLRAQLERHLNRNLGSEVRPRSKLFGEISPVPEASTITLLRLTFYEGSNLSRQNNQGSGPSRPPSGQKDNRATVHSGTLGRVRRKPKKVRHNAQFQVENDNTR